MRLKEDTSSWHSSSIIKRDYRHDRSKPEDFVPKGKSKKDTNKWCRGKKGVEHVLYRYFYDVDNRNFYYPDEYVSKRYIQTKCSQCKKKFYWKKNDPSTPLVIPIRLEGSDIDGQVQVKVNGVPIPFKYDPDCYYCETCLGWHH